MDARGRMSLPFSCWLPPSAGVVAFAAFRGRPTRASFGPRPVPSRSGRTRGKGQTLFPRLVRGLTRCAPGRRAVRTCGRAALRCVSLSTTGYGPPMVLPLDFEL